MLKFAHTTICGIFFSSVCLAAGTIALPVLADEAEEPLPPDYLGICRLNDLAGRTIIDSEGRLINLLDFCEDQQASLQLAIAQGEIEAGSKGEEFWQAFLNIASVEAIQFSRTVERQDVVSYGETICPLLNEGKTMQQVRQIQVEGGLPASFDAAVNVAAINTYCPQHSSQIGR